MESFLHIMMLALCIWREARGEPLEGKLMVGQVVENRVNDRRWPDTFESVILQKWQFSAFNPNDPNALKLPTKPDQEWLESLAAASHVVRYAPVTDANHYHVTGLHPKWEDPNKVVARVGHHVFYKL
jgi:N-acetylmuramoyl-L-alanine amidase